MAIEIYYTKENDIIPRKWYDANRPCRGSIATWMCFMHYMERKYLPSYPSAYSLKEYNSRFTATMFWNGEGDMPMQEIWDLQLSKKVTPAERLTMQSMMDKAYFLAADFPSVRNAWEEYVVEKNGGEGVTKAFTDLIATIESLIQRKPEIHSIGINWNSVNCFYDTFGETDKDCYDFVADNRQVEQRLNNSKSYE